MHALHISDLQIPSTNHFDGLYAFDDLDRDIFLSYINCLATYKL